MALALELRGAVDRERVRLVLLAVGPPLGAVEDVVGRDVDEPRAHLARGPRERAGSERVHREGALGLGFGGVHPVPGRGVEHHVGAHAGDERQHGRLVGHVERTPAAGPDELVAQAGRELAAELALRARDERPHAPIDSASAKSRAVRPEASCVVSVSVTFA